MCDCDCQVCINCEHNKPRPPRETFDPEKHRLGSYFTDTCADCGKRDWDDSFMMWPDFRMRCVPCYGKLLKIVHAEDDHTKGPT